MVALILADGDAPDRGFLDAHWPAWSDAIGLVVAADGGARHAESLGVRIDVWVGDGDSIDAAALAALAESGVEIEHAPPDKDETDTELAIHAALARDAGGVLLVGATGGARIDHEFANIALLATPGLIGKTAIIYTPLSMIRMLRGWVGPHRQMARMPVLGSVGDTVSIAPFGGDAVGVTTWGLRYPLHDATLPLGTPRGVSNVIESSGGQVALREGLLLVIETPATIDG